MKVFTPAVDALAIADLGEKDAKAFLRERTDSIMETLKASKAPQAKRRKQGRPLSENELSLVREVNELGRYVVDLNRFTLQFLSVPSAPEQPETK